MTMNAVRAARAKTGRSGPPAMTFLMCACVTVVVAMVAAVNLALPKLAGSDLEPTGTQLLWIVDSYILVFGCLLIPAGAVADRYGRKGVLLTGLGVFVLGCLLTAGAPGVTALLAGRVVTGAGAALVMPATLSLLLQVTPPAGRAGAIAAWTAATGAAGALGNLGGGITLQYLPWQGLFLATAPIAAVLAVLVARLAPRGERSGLLAERRRSEGVAARHRGGLGGAPQRTGHSAELDLVGTVLLTVAIFGLLFGIIEGPEEGWTSAPVLSAFAVAAVLLAGFVAYGMRAAHPVLDPRVFAVPRLRIGVLGVGLAFFGLFALFFVNAQYLQFVKGYSALLTGLAIGPLAVAMIVVTRRGPALVHRFGARRVVGGGLLLVAAGLAALSFAGAGTPYAVYAAILVAMASGMGLCLPALSTGIMSSLPPERAGMGSGLNSASREIGSALGVAVFGTVLGSRFRAELPPSLAHSGSMAQALRGAPDHAGRARVVTAFTDAMAAGFRVTAVAVLVAAVLVIAGFRARD